MDEDAFEPAIGFLTLVFLSLLPFLYQIIYYKFVSPLRHFPGPFWAGVTRLWLAWEAHKRTEYDTFAILHKKYGPVVRISPSMLSISDSRKLPMIYHRNSNKSGHYVSGGFGEKEAILNMRDHKVHAKHRKLMAGPYSVTKVRKLEYLIDARTEHFMDKLASTFAKTGEAFDFAPWAVYLTYDVISEIGFGEPLGFVDAGYDVDGLVESFHTGVAFATVIMRLYPFVTWIKKTPLKKYLVARPTDLSGIGILMQTRDRLIDKRIAEIAEGKREVERVDLLQTFLDSRDEDDEPLDMEYLKAEILLILLAGSDTTGTAFQGFVYMMLKHPDLYKRMMAEIDDVTAKGLLSSPPLFEQVQEHCPFYIACLRETNRLWSSAIGLLPREVMPSGMDLYGKFAPPGTEVTGNPLVMHRETSLYGDDAEEFRPDRWLEDPEKTKLFMKYSLTFGYGSRVCLGKYIALVELYKGPLEFFRRFTPKLVDQDKELVWNPIGGVAYWEGINMTISERNLPVRK